MKSNYLSYILCLLILFSCKNPLPSPKPEELYDRFEKSVVLIQNKYYYEIELNTGVIKYFTGFYQGELQNSTYKKEEIIENSNIAYGTGFFVTKDGLIATNRHVVSPEINEADILNKLKTDLDKEVFQMETMITAKKREIDDIDDLLYYYYDRLSYSDIRELETKKAELNNEREFWSEVRTKFDFNPNKSKVRLVVLNLSIAYNNTYVTKDEDYSECVLKSINETPEIDIALIQLKNKVTPKFVENIFDFEDHNPNIENGTMEGFEQYNLNNSLKIDKKVYMIGFNHGPSIANTEDGLKAQLTQGTVSQESDKRRVLYSIPSLEGSSGSPVIDEWGNLVAINFAKVSGTQNFNYGIIAKHLKKLIEEN